MFDCVSLDVLDFKGYCFGCNDCVCVFLIDYCCLLFIALTVWGLFGDSVGCLNVPLLMVMVGYCEFLA